MKVIKTTYQFSSSKNNEIIKLTNEIKNAFQKIEEKKNKTVNQYLSSIQSIKKETLMKITTGRKEMNSLNILLKKKEKSKTKV